MIDWLNRHIHPEPMTDKYESVFVVPICDLTVYASPLRFPSRRKTRFGLAATLGRTDSYPQGPFERSPRLRRHL